MSLSDGTRLIPTWSSIMPAGAGAVEWLTGDADADGKTDIFQLWNNNGFHEIIVWRSNGIRYQAYSDISGIRKLGPALQFIAGDINNDQRTDIIQLWDNVGRFAARTHKSYSTAYLTSADAPDLCAL